MKVTKVLIGMILFSVGLHFTSQAQQKDSLLVQLSRKWADSKAYALQIAALMPEEDYSFKPVPGEMSFKEQLLHIADNINWLSSDYLLVPSAKRIKDAAVPDKKAVIKILSDAYDNGLLAHGALSPAQLEERVSFFAGPISRRQILVLMHDHQAHHLGQLIVYLRLKGIKPPEYIGW
ncbi:MAG: hypothetical protein NVSMB24_27050 [Mucilaginibacter sp.]